MKKFASVTLVFITVCATLLFVRNTTRQAEAVIGPLNPPQKQQDLRREKFEPARKMLREAGVPFDPEILLSPDWKTQLVSELPEIQEMHTAFRSGSKMGGVQIADTIILPEKVELTKDLVILTNNLVLEGKHTEITGVGKNIYVYPISETFHLGKSIENALMRKGYSKETIPTVNERALTKFDFEGEKSDGVITIRAHGQGPIRMDEKVQAIY
jgi:hypothetical protein